VIGLKELMEIRKEKILGFMNEKSYQPLLFDELATVLDVPSEDREAFRQVIDELEADGHIIKTRKNRYGASGRMGFAAGRFQGNERGYGFVLPDNSEHGDIFIQTENINGAMHGDRVLVKVIKIQHGNKSAEGEIVKILSRANEKIVGVFEKSGSFGFVIPDHRKIKGDIFIPLDKTMNAKPHQKVVVEITRYPESNRNAEGRIVEILGDKDDDGIDVLSIIKAYNIPYEFPEEVLEEARKIPQSITDEEIEKRRDLRELAMVTIDGEDARDLDDAVSLEIIENGVYRLGVHIADVSYYVKENSALDKEAVKRGTSVYFPDRVIPMLPKELSNGICSLNAKEDRLAFSVIMDIDNLGRVVNHEVFESVIHVDERMTYTDVYKILEENDENLIARYEPLVPMFRNMKELALILAKKRSIRGAIDFDFEEAKIIVDEHGKPVEIKKYEMTIANKIIEEFMLLCNETVSEHFYWANIPFVYRIHEDPEPEKIIRLNAFLFNFGQRIKGPNHIHPRALQDVLTRIKGTPQERLISTMMLRSLQKARYSYEHEWHFGLAANYYSHFTSTIRRYPDLIIHRIMKEYINGEFDENRNRHYMNILPEITKQCSERERNAEEAERDCDDLKKAEYMLEHLGEQFTGVISNITSFGIFVELDNTIEGMIKLSSMYDDYYIYDEKQYCLIGENTGNIYRIGDVVDVIVVRSSPETRQIEFMFADDLGRDFLNYINADYNSKKNHISDKNNKDNSDGRKNSSEE
jgi:ribonuclease R